MLTHPWAPLIPGIPVVLSSLAFNFIGDGLRDALDPRLKM
jgi:peptide/nickel transport system permease protein